jgi:hypothetical protein
VKNGSAILDKTMKDYITRCITGKMLCSLPVSLFLIVLPVMISIMIYVFTGFEGFPRILLIIFCFPAFMGMLIFISNALVLYEIKRGDFEWQEGIVTEVVYPSPSGHRRKSMSWIMVDGSIKCDMAQRIGMFTEGQKVLVVFPKNSIPVAVALKP